MWGALIAPITGIINSVINRISPDKDLALKLQTEIAKELMTTNRSQIEGAINIILAEANGKSWLQRNWRPVLMISIVAIIVNNYILFPYLSLFGVKVISLNLPDKLYTLMEIGVGGYVVGRSGEKIMQTYKGNS